MSEQFESITSLLDSLKDSQIGKDPIRFEDVMKITKKFFNHPDYMRIAIYANDISLGTFSENQREQFLQCLMELIGRDWNDVSLKLLIYSINSNIPLIVNLWGRDPPTNTVFT